jgi:hypothetical protein
MAMTLRAAQHAEPTVEQITGVFRVKQHSITYNQQGSFCEFTAHHFLVTAHFAIVPSAPAAQPVLCDAAKFNV